ncbi:MAG: hypothetical protein ACD_19C00316G0002 [uncultured bacterium]|uniref:Transcription elongation factor GreA/GreB C-terminal domain-containing protein n=1 Tax=Candidatus Woesebacteria bacterium RIFCSPLOWO2_01_FULL_39_21 TaxID=1802519 RepID=A0A1F8BME1_9BACT|nr:MAG: hypothetical protein ACD_19C00316G0002 [uncultured bacterium]OGM22382.1 MAG: hypothetical protein A2691_02065 [Candidatus Woesebacteria bacterium RIFCSPHIGHO2_01_FULL_39_23]OGM65213.1 MAG: hypothetical protein A2961_00770 [Candidatus Woesebacteria bacterium RIFCSPLOWO2_01_FULL_39_21]
MDFNKLLKQKLIEKREKLIKGLTAAKEARDKAPTAMESHSDTTRSQNERLAVALESELIKLDIIISDFSSSEWKCVELSIGDKALKVCLVPEGFGGEDIGDVKLISSNSPLGSVISGKKKGEEFTFNGQKGKII